MNNNNSQISFLLYPKLVNILKYNNLNPVYSLESKIIAPVFKMERLGINFDVEKCDYFINKFKILINEIENRCFEITRRKFSLNSHREIAKILFVDLALPAYDANFNGTRKNIKHYSTKRETLEKLASLHELPRLLINWRKIQLALTNYLLPFRKRVKFNNEIQSNVGKIYSFYDLFTATGRIIMREPSLQTFPKTFTNEYPLKESFNLRTLIVPSQGILNKQTTFVKDEVAFKTYLKLLFIIWA